MAGGDSDGTNDRLNGLVNLLQVVGIDGVDSDVLVEAQKRASKPKTKSSNNSKSSSTSRKNNTSSDTTTRTAPSTATNDAQILEIVKKLQQAQADSPEIQEALKSPELLALASLVAQNQSSSSEQNTNKSSLATSLDDIDDEDDNYPKIGPGYSDDISVVSDMTTPTVMTRQRVADEEHYREMKGGQQNAIPSMRHTGSGGQKSKSPSVRRKSRITRPSSAIGTTGGGKTKNMVSQVRPTATVRRANAIPTKMAGGAAAQRRLNYQMAMNKLEVTGFGKQTPPSSRNKNRGNTDQDTLLLSPLSAKKQTDFFHVTSPTKSVQSNKSSSNNNADGGKTRRAKSKYTTEKSNPPPTASASGTKNSGSNKDISSG